MELIVRLTQATSVIKKVLPEHLPQNREDEYWVADRNLTTCLPESASKRFLVDPGEQSKTWRQVGEILEWLASEEATRGSKLIALGGGVIGDLAGFAAASYMRGISLIQIPTSLLAMVDSSVGGKTGVDLKNGKNLAGAFWPAEQVLICIDLLETLPEREWLCGSAEVWKYGAIMDLKLWERLLEEPISRDCPHLEQTIWRCIDLKRQVVEADEFERSGLRATLNFGHTVGHAIEWALQYQQLNHGEAISIGMVVESEIGELMGFTQRGTTEAVRAGLKLQGLPTTLPAQLSPDDLIPAMRRDKKSSQGRIAMSLLPSLGTCKLVDDVPEPLIRQVLARQ